MNTNNSGLRWFSKDLCIIVLWTKVVSPLEGLTILCKNPEDDWHMGTHMRVLGESYPMNTNMRWFSKNESGLSIGRVKSYTRLLRTSCMFLSLSA